MSCVLRLSATGLDELLSKVAVKPYRIENGTAHFSVSDCAFEDFSGQVKEAIAFLLFHASDLRLLMGSAESDGVLDFAVVCPSDGFHFNAFASPLGKV